MIRLMLQRDPTSVPRGRVRAESESGGGIEPSSLFLGRPLVTIIVPMGSWMHLVSSSFPTCSPCILANVGLTVSSDYTQVGADPSLICSAFGVDLSPARSGVLPS